MLDTDTKRRIDTARDILVGKVPDPKSQVEQITIALIYKFMNDMDVEAEELGGERNFFSGEYERYAWHNLMNPQMGGHDVLNLYADSIQKMVNNVNIPQLFRDIFKNAYLPYRDPETLKSFLKVINDFDYDHSERLGDAFEYLLSVLGSQGDAGQFRTPRHIIDFMVSIIDPKKDETILDPACGTAGFLISAYKHILKTNSSNYDAEKDQNAFELHGVKLSELTINGKRYKGDNLTPDERNRIIKNIRGYDISPDMVRLSLVNLYLHGFTDPHIYEYDTLTSDERWNEFADVILANPPFMSPKGGIRPHKRFSVFSNRSEVLFVDYMAEHLTPNGRAAIIVPEGIIFQSGTAYKSLRKMLVDENYLVGVISLPAGMFNPYSGVKTSILWLDKSLAKKTDKILFAKIAADGFDLGAQRRPTKENDLPGVFKKITQYKNALINGETIDFISINNILIISKNEIRENSEYNLSGERYKELITYTTDYDFVAIGELCEIFNGSRPKGGAVNEGILSIGGEHIKYDGSFNLDNPRFIPINYFKELKKGKLQINDVLIVKDGATTGKAGFYGKSAPFNEGAVNEHVFILRNISQTLIPYYLFQLLRSESGQREILKYKVGAAVGGINLNIKNLKIPLPPLSVQEEIVAEIEGYQKIIDGTRQVVENYKPQIPIDPEWDMVELGEVCQLNPKKSEVSNLDDELEVSFVPMAVVNENEMFFEVKGSKKISEVYQGYTYFKEDDVLLARVTPCFENGKAGIARNLHNGFGFGSSEFYVIRPNDKIKSEWIYINVITNNLRTEGKLRMTGTGGLQRVPKDFVSHYQIPLPDITIQEKTISKILKEIEIVESNKELITIFEQKIKDKIASVWGE